MISPRPRRNCSAKRAPRPASSRVFNRQSVQAALRSLIAKLGTYSRTPPNGLALFCGYALDPIDGKERKISLAIDPWAPLTSGMYRCDSKFHTQLLKEQLDDQSTFGFIVMDGSQTTFHTLTGSCRQTVLKIEVELPKKHGRGGQSKNRFERIRVEKRGWYSSKVAALTTQYFIDSATNLPNVKGLVVAGSAFLKEEMMQKMDPRLTKIVLTVVDVQYSGETGFNQAITLAAPVLADVKLVHERNLLSKFFDDIARTGKYCFGVEDTVYALTSGLLEVLLLWKGISVRRVELVVRDEKKILFVKEDESLSGEQWGECKLLKDEPLVDWVLDHYKEFGAKVDLISDQTELSHQFIRGFGGLGGFLRFDTNLPSSGLLEEVQDDVVAGGDTQRDEDYEYVW